MFFRFTSENFYVLFLIQNVFLYTGSDGRNSSCGWDGSPVTMVYEGEAAIETYPWMGMLYYPIEARRFTTSVVLVTRQMVIAAASEIDKLPKTNFRVRARVVLGHKCGVGSEIKVRDYTYHPEYVKDSSSALAIIQLETDHAKTELHPICQPPAHFIKPQFYAMTLISDCRNPKVEIHRMTYVSIDECKTFYRRSGLDQVSLWPRHAACARSVSGGRCLWHSGSVLAIKQDGRWRLLGFSVYGPGCGDPARFLDYGMYHQWVRLSSTTVGMPAITRIQDNHLVMRRSLGNLQRYGPCDAEEKISELYSDKVTLLYRPGNYHAKYNITIYANVEYSCITFKARPYTMEDYEKIKQTPQPEGEPKGIVAQNTLPKIRLRRWCATSAGSCHGFQHIEIQFYVDINFSQSVDFTVHVYGREAKVISSSSAIKYVNVNNGTRPEPPSYLVVLKKLKKNVQNSPYKWFYKKDLYAKEPVG